MFNVKGLVTGALLVFGLYIPAFAGVDAAKDDKAVVAQESVQLVASPFESQFKDETVVTSWIICPPVC